MLVVLLSTIGMAEDDANAPAPVVAATAKVHDLTVQADQQATRLAAVEHFLRDQRLVKDGLAPKGWVQPPLASYLAPDAPSSFVPGHKIEEEVLDLSASVVGHTRDHPTQ